MPPTRGFESYADLANHFYRHVTRAREFDFRDEEEYEAAAMRFISRPLDVNTEEYLRRDGRTIRFDRATNEICFLDADGFIGTYFRVRCADPYAYFQRKCRG